MDHDVGALLFELQSLRAELLFYKQHHQNCALIRQPSPPPDSDCCGGRDSLTIVPFKPGPVGKPKPKPEAEPAWRPIAAQLLQSVPDAQAWIPSKKSLGLEGTSIICVISGISHISRANIDPPAHCITLLTTDSASLIASATKFALITRRSQYRTNLTSLVRAYQECVLVSLCVVLEHHGIDMLDINTVMRVCITDSEDKHLYTLRLGAVWLNRTIVELGKSWGRRAGEAFFLSGLSILKYARLAMNKSSGRYIIEKLHDQQYFSEQIDALDDTPLSIPAFIKMIVKDRLTLQQICTSLGYDDSLEEIGDICAQYNRILDITTLTGPSIQARNKKRKLGGPQGAPLAWDPIKFLEDLEWEELYLGGEEGAEEGTEVYADENIEDDYVDPYMGADDRAISV